MHSIWSPPVRQTTLLLQNLCQEVLSEQYVNKLRLIYAKTFPLSYLKDAKIECYIFIWTIGFIICKTTPKFKK